MKYGMEIGYSQEIVRCNVCRFFDSYNVECTKNHDPRPPYDEWFCADGKRREENG